MPKIIGTRLAFFNKKENYAGQRLKQKICNRPKNFFCSTLAHLDTQNNKPDCTDQHQKGTYTDKHFTSSPILKIVKQKTGKGKSKS
jgi:hypothetical protein